MYLHTQLDDFQCQHQLASSHIQNQISHLSNRHIPNHYRLSAFLSVTGDTDFRRDLKEERVELPCLAFSFCSVFPQHLAQRSLRHYHDSNSK